MNTKMEIGTFSAILTLYGALIFACRHPLFDCGTVTAAEGQQQEQHQVAVAVLLEIWAA